MGAVEWLLNLTVILLLGAACRWCCGWSAGSPQCGGRVRPSRAASET